MGWVWSSNCPTSSNLPWPSSSILGFSNPAWCGPLAVPLSGVYRLWLLWECQWGTWPCPSHHRRLRWRGAWPTTVVGTVEERLTIRWSRGLQVE
jgi:hypothetical protein